MSWLHSKWRTQGSKTEALTKIAKEEDHNEADG